MSSYPNHFDIACFLPLSRRLHVTAPDASRDGRHGARPGDAYTAGGPGVCRPFLVGLKNYLGLITACHSFCRIANSLLDT